MSEDRRPEPPEGLYHSMACDRQAESGRCICRHPDPNGKVALTEAEYRRQAYAAGRRLTCRRRQCRAKPGKPCVTKAGKKARRDHAERFYDGASKAAAKRSKS